jgi:hypothetical protein
MSYPTNVYTNGVQFVANYGNDGDYGFSWGTAKASVAAAMDALPNGSTDGSTGTGVVFLEPGYTGTIPTPASPTILIGYPTVGAGASAVSGATSSTVRNIIGQVTLDYAGSTSVTGSVVGVRGAIVVNAGTTVIGSSYLFGSQGKVTVNGALANTGGNGIIATGIFGQIDLSNCTTLSSQITAGWFDCGAAASAAAVAGEAYVDVITAYNNISTLTANSVMRVLAKATYLFDLSDNTSFIIGTAAGSGWDKSLKINLNGTPYYIPCNSAAS